MTEFIQPFEAFASLPREFWLPLYDLLIQDDMQVEHWTPEMAHDIYEVLEHPNWAPWLEASEATIAGRAKVFPKGQLALKNHGELVASLSMNQIDWDGNPDTLPSWDQVAGKDTTDYSETYKPDGNTLVLMSMNVAPDSKGKKLPSKLVEYAKLLAMNSGIKYLLGSFRPSGYGKAKKESGYKLGFWDYCQMKTPGTEKPLDPWLKSLSYSGMHILKEDPHAMAVSVSKSEMSTYMKMYHPELWSLRHIAQSGMEIWECGEVGYWQVPWDPEKPNTYIESNVWGEIPIW